MKITICCSVKYRDLVKETVKNFEAIGITPLFPNLDCGTDGDGGHVAIEEQKRLASEHYAAIDDADKVYLITPEGYMGTSVKLELGYAIAKNKPIYFSEPTSDVSLDCYALEFVPTGSLKRFLEL